MNRYLKITALGTIIVLMLTVVLLRTWSSAAAVGSSSGTWNIVPCAKPSSNGGYLVGISAASASDIWAVGTYTPDQSPFQAGLIEHWDGTQWSVVPSPTAGIGSSLSAVSTISSSDAWAVGSYETADSVSLSLIEHWNGTQWSIVPSPNSGSFFNYLVGVTATSSDDAWAVGDYGGTDSNPSPSGTLIEHWDGTSWRIIPNPTSLNGGSVLRGVTAIAHNFFRTDVWAVGDRLPPSTSNPPPQTLIERWNGKRWNIISSPNPSDEASLSGITAISSTDIWVAGKYNAQTLTEHWNGEQWSVVPSPNPSSMDNTVSGMTAISSDDVWAVGSYVTTGDYGSYQTLIEHWDGTQWSIVSSPNDGTSDNFLYGVTRVPGTQQMWAVGKGEQLYTEFYS